MGINLSPYFFWQHHPHLDVTNMTVPRIGIKMIMTLNVISSLLKTIYDMILQICIRKEKKTVEIKPELSYIIISSINSFPFGKSPL